MSTVADWLGANLVPLVLIPLAALLLWVGIWRVWLPAAPVPTSRKTSASSSLRRDGAVPRVVFTTVVTLWVGREAAFASTVVTVRAVVPPIGAGGSHTRQIPTQSRTPASGSSTSGTRFEPTQSVVLDMREEC